MEQPSASWLSNEGSHLPSLSLHLLLNQRRESTPEACMRAETDQVVKQNLRGGRACPGDNLGSNPSSSILSYVTLGKSFFSRKKEFRKKSSSQNCWRSKVSGL